MQKKGDDYYDVEIINGIHIPISFAPVNGIPTENPYICGTPGAKIPSSDLLGESTWQF